LLQSRWELIQCIREENWAVLGYYAAISGNFLPKFQDNLSIPSSGEEINHQSLHENLEEHNSLLFSDALCNQEGPNMEMLYYHCLSTLSYIMPFERFKVIRRDWNHEQDRCFWPMLLMFMYVILWRKTQKWGTSKIST
jgi:hypothetical protein